MMRRNRSFWRSVIIIGVVHAAVLFGLARWSGSAKKPAATEILWMDAGAAGVAPAVASAQPVLPEIAPAMPPPAAAEDEATTAPPDEEAIAMSVKSETEQQTPTPLPSPAETPTARPAPVQKTSPEARSTPSPKATPKTTSRKTRVAKGTTPAPKATPVAKKAAESEAKKVAVDPAPSGNASSDANDSAAASSGSSGHGRGPGGASQFNWYSNMLHDRFFSEWDQPTSVVASGAKMSVLVRLRIEKDGRVSDFTVARPSGNVVVDESVAAVAKRVARVDPLPAGLGSSGHYEVNIRFELNPEQ